MSKDITNPAQPVFDELLEHIQQARAKAFRQANTTLIALIDRIRMLDNDLIRLQQKVNTTLHLRGKIIESERVVEAQKVDSEADKKFKKAISDEPLRPRDRQH